MVDLIVITPHGIDAETEVYHCDVEGKTPIECLKEIWKRDLSYFNKSHIVDKYRTTFIEKDEEADIYFIDSTYYHYELSYASSLKDYFKYSHIEGSET